MSIRDWAIGASVCGVAMVLFEMPIVALFAADQFQWDRASRSENQRAVQAWNRGSLGDQADAWADRQDVSPRDRSLDSRTASQGGE